MIKIALFWIIVCNVAFAYTYEQTILKSYAKIAPRIILMSENHRQISENIEIFIVYEEGDEESAQLLKSYMLEGYPRGLNNHLLKIKTVSYDSFKDAPKYSLVFLFDGEDSHIQKVISFTKKKHILSMSYHYSYLDYGVLLSLHVGKTLKPYLNIKAAKESGIIFKNNLIAISKIFYPKEQP